LLCLDTEWITLVLFIHLLILIIVAIIKLLLPKSPPLVNQSVNKKDPKVVDLVDIEDLDKEKISYCRCWRSKKVCNFTIYQSILSIPLCFVVINFDLRVL